MSTLKFTWTQDLDGNSQKNTFNVLNTNFGDGYEQTVSIGINNCSRQWQYTKTDVEKNIIEIKNFFDLHKGSKSFLWDSPLDGEVRVKVGEYQPVHLGGGWWRITTTFTQVYYP
ncbi:phage tail protein [Acinetobacter pittii]|uniref:phage tail protein n=1 Tax=Acinetobacter pittii TaxID=48296 RepID=UPI002A04958E|nr:phage tail protein [Acinetobacter pittii]MDX8155673.1 phage tail protein [Acinetobacter pittii]